MLQVKTLTGKEIEIDIEPTDTVQRIKERVEEKEGIPPVQQRCVLVCGSGDWASVLPLHLLTALFSQPALAFQRHSSGTREG